MGQVCGMCGIGNPRDEDKVIGRRLQEISNERSRTLKILLLGTGDSGKTTVFKQMKILYGGGVEQEERESARRPIFQELVKGAQAIVEACGVLEGTRELENPKSILAANVLQDMDADRVRTMTQETARAIATLWEDPEFQKTWDKRSDIQVIDSWGKFASQCKRYPEFGGEDWIPTLDDYLNSRSRSTGSITEQFVIDSTAFQLVDVGGQRNERRKWIFVFEGVTAVLFVAAISEYDQTLFEEESKNRLEEAFDLFEKMVNSGWFKRTNMILFLNKSDIFREKLVKKRIPLNKTGLFPTAPTGFEEKPALAWIKQEFFARCRNDQSLIFPHVTTAIDTGNMRYVLNACKFIILKDAVDKLLR